MPKQPGYDPDEFQSYLGPIITFTTMLDFDSTARMSKDINFSWIYVKATIQEVPSGFLDRDHMCGRFSRTDVMEEKACQPTNEVVVELLQDPHTLTI